ncbi:DUF4175 family protein [Dokdonia sp. Hel_I_53]|uniref:DUF4175 family protein n=1 Tax=Dokdonia sp. Hel_I_53 TaxID=1566287 RepID=UPI00119B924C|nr:DUF4175 family protein [Dokdonia sp. Hel_I_53]TVZ52647.1 hypothetical protein OD90_1829 [Dokdonia sp. Hel_I_53]
MKRYEQIEKKLESFISKFYINELLKGIILFVAFGALYFLFILFVEYFLWLSPAGRTVLFWLFILVEVGLFAKFILIPILRLFKISKGINYTDAADIIGNYFPEVNDKLVNTLQLKNIHQHSELSLASVEQKCKELEPIPFKLAIDLKKNTHYFKYALIPLFIFLLVNYLGQGKVLQSSYNRVINYNKAYKAPAPFSFFILNENLQGIENTDYELHIRTVGSIIPEDVSIHYNNEVYFLQQIAPGEYTYVFEKPLSNIDFYLKGNKVLSKNYSIEIVKAPIITQFVMELSYPNYTKKLSDKLQNTGNAIIPEGTKVTWNLGARETSEIDFIIKDSVQPFSLENREGAQYSFDLSRSIFNNTTYEIRTSNEKLKNYERLVYTLQVVKDQYPKIELNSKRDTINEQQQYFYGTVSDDYGLSKLQLVYYPENSDKKFYDQISISSNNVDQFVYAFPNNLNLEKGVNYNYYFEIFDNDVLHNYKKTKSTVYSFVKLTREELEKKQLDNQEAVIKNFDKSLSKINDREKELQEITKTQKEKDKLTFNDQKKLENFLNRQEKQEALMKDFSKQLKQNLEEFQKDNDLNDEDKALLKDRLERQEKKARENEKLLKELQELREKMPKEKLSEKLEQLEKQNRNNKRNLEQMVELTKRYYVQKKAEQITNELAKLAEIQEALSKKSGPENTQEKQDQLNKEFQNIEKSLTALEKENSNLKKPLDLPTDEKKQKEINEEQKQASTNLDKNNSEGGDKKSNISEAQKNQKKAASKMKQMGNAIAQQMQMSGEKSLEEDAQMLRQVLDNLLVFSFEEEAIMNEFRRIDGKNPNYAAKLKRQNILKQNFTHIDDSLYALALRQPKLDEVINEALVDIDYNMDKALERLAESEINQGVSSQQYVVSGANQLADLLSQSLDDMQNAMMSGSGKGSGQGIPQPGSGSGGGEQLPDIIQSQEQLNKQMSKATASNEGSKGSSSSQGGKDEEPGKTPSANNENNQGEGKGNEGISSSPNNSASGNSNEGDNPNNQDDYQQGLLYEIYKQQSKLRQQLEDAIQKEGVGNGAQQLVRDMENVEQQLLDKGFSNEVLEKMLNLKHKLLKLESATLQQGEDKKRESATNILEYDNSLNSLLNTAKQYFNTTEILSRKALPIKEEYKKKIQDYFQETDDRI